MQRTAAWMRDNLTTRGYCLSDVERRELAVGLVGTLLAAGATTAGLILGGMLVAACAAVTAVNFCVPSVALAMWERRLHDQPITS